MTKKSEKSVGVNIANVRKHIEWLVNRNVLDKVLVQPNAGVVKMLFNTIKYLGKDFGDYSGFGKVAVFAIFDAHSGGKVYVVYQSNAVDTMFEDDWNMDIADMIENEGFDAITMGDMDGLMDKKALGGEYVIPCFKVADSKEHCALHAALSAYCFVADLCLRMSLGVVYGLNQWTLISGEYSPGQCEYSKTLVAQFEDRVNSMAGK